MTEKNERVPSRAGMPAELDPMNRWFTSPFQLSRLFNEPQERRSGARVWSPAVEVSENAQGYAITVEIPGGKKDDVVVDCHDGVLTIKGEKKSEREEKDEHRHFVERRYGSFSRLFRLPDDAASDRVAANFKDGVLTIEIPRAEEKKPTVINIQ